MFDVAYTSQGSATTVPTSSLRPGDSPRLNGEDQGHIAWLASTGRPLPAILVQQGTMRVIDAMHRLLAATLKGSQTVDVVFFDGSDEDAFLRAVEANVRHGLPLSQADRRAAARRIVRSHPHMSDRAIAESSGLAAKTIADIRRRSTDAAQQLNARVGRDGKVRPLNNVDGRLKAAYLLAARPSTPLREVAKYAGISPATARDVRLRLQRGEEPVPPGVASAHAKRAMARGRASPSTPTPAPGVLLSKLTRDPALRHTESGRRMLHLLRGSAVIFDEWPLPAEAVPPHCAPMLAQLARRHAESWLQYAQELDEHSRSIGM